MMQLKKILVPKDFSKEAELAVEWAVKLGREEKEATIYLVHILPLGPVVEGGIVIEEVIQAEWDNAKERLEEWRRKIPPPLSSIALIGKADPVREISWVCNEHNIDLVVMTTQGRHGLSRLVRPNLSEKVVREAPCPVLVLHLNPKMEAIAKVGV
jgi:nucleotide-binding universal stress UspA family protein